LDNDLSLELDRRSLVAQMTDKLRGMILQGRLQLGEELNEAHLAQQFSVGRGTIREALRTLVAERLVEKEPRRTWRIRQISERQIWEVAVVRGKLESLAAFLAVQQVTPEAAGLLTAAVDDMRSAKDEGNIEMLRAADLRFHRSLVETARNAVLLEAWSTIFAHSELMFAGGKATYSVEESVKAHQRMLEAILSGDSCAAELEVRDAIFESYRRPTYEDMPKPWAQGKEAFEREC
jgi:DNA-binding GntR family transcriptional regulator